ncbi:MAG: thiolase family protein [Proteobacteria bacterium]|nr:thiolase family protein [Pseudomonadota bacterium]
MGWEFRNKAAVCGIGLGPVAKDTGLGNTALIGAAVREALADCGLAKAKLDGLFVNAGVDVDRLAENLGLACRYANQAWTHGRLSGPIVQSAALACVAGLADYIACIYSIDISERGGGFGGGRSHAHEEGREGGGPHGEMPHYGLTHPGSGAAMAMRKYMARYGATAEQLGMVAVTQRAHAALNPAAMMKAPMTLADYLAARPVIEPLRLFDFCVVNDGAICVIVTTAERARDLRKPPVHIAGMQGLRAGREEFVFGRPGLGVWQQTEREDLPQVHPVFAMAGVERKDVDGLMIYDSFSPQVIFGLEEFGYVGPGEAAAWIASGNGRLDGRLPVNTHGGHLSEGMLAGWGHQLEAVRQLRGEAGARQIPDAEVIQYLMGTGVSIIYTR